MIQDLFPTLKNADKDSRGEKHGTPMVLSLLWFDWVMELIPKSPSPLSKLSLQTFEHMQ